MSDLGPDTTRIPTEADRVLAGQLSTIWPLSTRHPSDALHLAIWLNDNADAEVAAGRLPEPVWRGAIAHLDAAPPFVPGEFGVVGETVGHEFDDDAGGTIAEWDDAFGEHRTRNDATGGEKGTKIERYDLVPTEPLRWLAEMYGRGALKYDARNWERGYEWSKSYSALCRHLQAFWNGELLIPQNEAGDDPTAGVPHLTAVAWHAFALLEWVLRTDVGDEDQIAELDDRPTPFRR